LSNDRILRIGIAPLEAIKQRTLDIASGKRRHKSDEPRVWFTSLDALARVLSKQNMLLIEMIRHSHPESVAELAARVGRAKSNVLRSLRTLEEFNIVTFESGRGGRKVPRMMYDDFRVDIYLGLSRNEKAA
jgi:predicted transcriptional regulator